MVLTPVMSRLRAAAAVSSGAAMVCLAGVGFTALPANSSPGAVPVAAAQVSAESVRLVAQVTPLAARLPGSVPASGGLGGGPGGGSGGGSDGSGGDAVAPSPAKHASGGGSSSSSSGGSTGNHVASAESPGLVAGIFKHVGHWLGLSGDDSKTSSDTKTSGDPAPKPTKPAGAGSGSPSSEGGSAGPGPGGKSADTSGASDIVHSVFSGLGRFFSGLFGG